MDLLANLKKGQHLSCCPLIRIGISKQHKVENFRKIGSKEGGKPRKEEGQIRKEGRQGPRS